MLGDDFLSHSSVDPSSVGGSPFFGGNAFSTILILAIIYLVLRKLQQTFFPFGGGKKKAPTIDFRAVTVPYLKAVVSGAVAVLIIWEFVPGSPMDSFDQEVSSWLYRIAVIFSIIPLLMLATPYILIVGLCIRAMKVRRGFLDILTGTLGNTLCALSNALFGPQPMGGLEAIWFTLPFTLAGAIGGFVFWRATGYPGLKKSTARTLNKVQRGVDVVDDLASGSAFGVGRSAHTVYQAVREDSESSASPAKAVRPRHIGPRSSFGRRAKS